MHTRWARVARGCSAASFATFVAAFSHSLAGGSVPSAFGLFVSLVLSVMVCTLLSGRTLSVWRLAASVGVSQFLFHTIFSDLGTPVAAAHTMGNMSGMADAALPYAAASMWLAHGVAALVTVVALRFSGRAFWGMADSARLLFARLVRAVVPVTPTHVRPAHPNSEPVTLHHLLLPLSPMRHRGPPLELA